MSRLRFTIGTCVLCLLATGCVQPTPGNGNTNDNGSSAEVLAIPLGELGVFGEGTPNSLQNSGPFDIADQVPEGEFSELRLSVDASDISIGTAYDADTTGAGSVLLLAYFAPAENETPCTESTTIHFFDFTFENNEVVSITPDSEILNDPNDVELLTSGIFGLCVVVSSPRDVAITVENLRVTYVPPGEIVATNCAEVRALAQVEAAIGGLSASGITFDLPAGADPPDVEGSYTLEESTTFDEDGDNTGDTQTGDITLDNQSGSSIRRTGFDASVDQYISGNATTVGFCTFARTNNPACDQSIARLETLAYDAETGDLAGNFLAVVVARHASTSLTCADAGSFIYGDLTLTAQRNQLAQRVGKVELDANFTPDLMILPGDGGDGTVTDFEGPNVLQFATVTPFATTAFTLPETITPVSFSALGIARDDSRVAVVTDQPDAAITYDSATREIVRATATTNFDYIGGCVDFNLDATRIYVPSTHVNFSDRITVLRTDDSTFADEVRKFNMPQGKLPVQARVSPDGERIAVLLEGGAPIGEAADLTFGSPDNGNYLTATIDLDEDAGGTVLASELLYAPDGSRVFMAGLGAVVAVEGTSPYAITRIDVSNGAGDNPIALAMSGDGAVLAVAIDDANGSADFAVVDTDTLEVLNMQDLPGIGVGRALDVAHFENTRVAMVANLESTVVAVQTVAPFAADNPVLVADITDANALGRMEAGGSTIAVSNIQEPAIYIFKPIQ